MTTIQTKVCEHCGLAFETKPIKNGSKQRFCNPQCRKSNYKGTHVLSPKEKLNAEVRHLRSRLKKYALTIEDYEFELENHKYVCAICRQPETSTNLGTLRQLSIDHNHETGCYRGLLCGKCNRGLGYFKEDIAILKLAIEYLERHKDPRDNT
jgi:transposase-like protein